jgi:hypothetical protein
MTESSGDNHQKKSNRNQMKRVVYSVATLLVFTLLSCGPTQRVTSSWVNPQRPTVSKYNKVFIAALVNNAAYKNVIENDLAAAATARGYQVVKSGDLISPNFTNQNAPTKDAIVQQVRSSGCDAIFTVSLVDKQSETRYVPGTTTYSPYMGYGGYGFGGYYGYMAPSMYSTPGYTTTDKTYFMEARLFDAASENMVWSAQSEAYNPSKIDKFSKDYSSMLVEQMQKDLGPKK